MRAGRQVCRVDAGRTFPQGGGPSESQERCISGASMPKRRTRAVPSSIVSPSMTRARPDRSARNFSRGSVLDAVRSSSAA